MKTVVIGIGNPYRGDDAAGAIAVDLVADRLPAASGAVCKRVERGGLGLMEEMAGFERAILIDACRGGGRPGAIHRRDRASWIESRNTSSTHDGSLIDALEAGRLAGVALPAEWMAWGIEPGDMEGFSTELTAPVRQAVERVVAAVLGELAGEGDGG